MTATPSVPAETGWTDVASAVEGFVRRVDEIDARLAGISDSLDAVAVATRVLKIAARFSSLRESQSKPGLATSSRRERADHRHSTERELARQDVPWMLSQLGVAAREIASLRSQLAATREGETPT